VTRAFFFLTWRSLRNRVAYQLRRSRNPRYALALAIGVAYFYFVFWRNPRRSHGQVFPLLSDAGHLVVLGGLLLGAVGMWLFGGDSTALAFSQAEASFLFPAPVSRRQLVIYKIVRGQLPLLFNVLIWVLLLDAGRTGIPFWARAAALWLLFATIFLHRLGSSLVRTAWAEHGAAGVRRNVLSLTVFAVIVVGVAASLVGHVAALRAAAGLSDRVAVLNSALAQLPARVVLWPFSALLAPLFANSLELWAHALPGAMLVVAVHVWWVLHTDTAFEEAALAATAERARRLEALRGRRGPFGAAAGSRARPAKRSGARRGAFVLAPVGHPAVAIVWKNFTCLRRTTQLKQFLSPVVLAAVGGALIGSETGGMLGGLAVGALILAALLLVLGPLMLRGDLRQDLQHLAELKTLPFSGRTIVVAEVLSVSIPLAVFQTAALAAAAVLARAAHLSWGGPALRAAIVVGAVPVLLAFNATSVTIQNGAPILFPGWARLGTVVAGGVEMMGQMILLMGFYLLLLAALLVLPAAAALASVATLHLTGAPMVLVAMLVGSAGLAFELQGVMQLLGRAFERLEPGAVSG
jgi:Putative ABC exporter